MSVLPFPAIEELPNLKMQLGNLSVTSEVQPDCKKGQLIDFPFNEKNRVEVDDRLVNEQLRAENVRLTDLLEAAQIDKERMEDFIIELIEENHAKILRNQFIE